VGEKGTQDSKACVDRATMAGPDICSTPSTDAGPTVVAHAHTHLRDDGLAIKLAAVQLFLGDARRRSVLERDENLADVLVRWRYGLAGRMRPRNDTRYDLAKLGTLINLWDACRV
jgi:hypothetical protein